MVSVKKISSFFIIMLLYFAVFLRIYYFPSYNVFRNICLIILVCYIGLNYKTIFQPKNIKTNLLVILFSAVIVIASLFNGEHSVKYINDMVVFCTSLFVVYSISQIMCEKRLFVFMIKNLYIINLIMVLITDFVLLANKKLVTEYEGYYLIGNKFHVAYAHLFLVVLYAVIINSHEKKRRRNYVILILLMALTWSITDFIGCASGLVGMIFLGVFFIIFSIKNGDWIKGHLALGVLLVSSSFVVFYDIILSIPAVQKIVQDYFEHSLNLSGRIYIYARLPELLSGKWVLGFGYGTTYDLGMKFGKFPNTQNGLMEWIWQCGIIGTIVMLILMWNSLSKVNAAKTSKLILPLLALVNVFSVLASVEITLNIMFFGVLSLIFAYTSYQEKEKEKTVI